MKKNKFIIGLKSNEVIYAPTKEIAEKLCKKFKELGLNWADGDDYLEDNKYDTYDNRTCYRPYIGGYGSVDYYHKNKYTIYSIDDLLDFYHPQLDRGEKVLVKNEESEKWKERIFVSEIKGSEFPYVCVIPDSEYKFIEGELFRTSDWKYIRRKENAVTRKEIADAFGLSEDFEIID